MVFGIRPEHLIVGDGGDSMKGKVVVMEPTGADTQVLCRIGHSDIIVVSHDRHRRPCGRQHLAAA